MCIMNTNWWVQILASRFLCTERWVRADSLFHIFLIGKTWMKVIWQHESIKYYNKLPQNSLVADIQIFHECWMVLPL